ncbi:OpgC domain-containing protein [Rhizobacter sp. Root1221]|uniref:OpgC domain-containing protein n=1 Tax=Rhizobacter sp. Root1221 TaxID=1736433 RepID=UPI0009E69E56|nr:OpgC domain-containing protein [Rhizobacter sp. Root1221]
MTRRWELDALRGLMLVLMILTHLPTRVAVPLGQPLGYVSAAEGFVMLSAYMAGIVYTLRARRDGEPEMREAFLRRALKIYACQAALLVFLFTVVGFIDLFTDETAIANLTSFFRQDPAAAVFGAALLLYNPPLLDILPMYIVFMLASPVLLLHGLHQGWTGILAGSLALWFASQFGLGGWLYAHAVDLTGLPVPAAETGSFALLAWQFLWVLGLWMGAVSVTPARTAGPLPRAMVATAAVYAVVCLVWRHAVGQVPFGDRPALNLLFDKWHLGPLRLLDFLALMLLAMHFAPWLQRHLPRLRVLEAFGAASLTVFCGHLVLALVALALVGEFRPGRPVWVDAVILVGGFVLLYAVARVQQWATRRAITSRRTTAPPARARTPVH